MSLTDITREGVLKAITEFQELGRDEFLRRYGFKEARTYLLVHEDAFYDSKAIAGVAHRHTAGRPLTAGEFSGGEKHAVRVLRSLGFEVRSTRTPPWDHDELVLLCAVLAGNGWQPMAPDAERVQELSEFLRRLPLHRHGHRGPDFRTPDEVARKMAELAESHLPENSDRDEQILRAFRESPTRMNSAAEALRKGVESGPLMDLAWSDEVIDAEVSAPEGRMLFRWHLVRERDPALRKKRIDQARARHGALACEVCGFDYERTYGPRGADYIECHHVVPLHVSGETTTRLNDLALLCANCHRMIHRSSPWPTPAELRELVTRRRS
ncbi:HNH endonuclease [Actinomadura logoneensis]|uniref:HNH endonuclease n=1 Tax=Actinomadura logoneensis TaxID=2293572 RepID=A0A372JLD0_9ACTN|nr:HNH endonuclease [Actinomadura logoneensis]RFU40626.1 HNH endonuclease [Actinomadura logoneensis]